MIKSAPFFGGGVGFLQALVSQKTPVSSLLNSVQALLCPSAHPEPCLLPELVANAICWRRAELAWPGVGWRSWTHGKALGTRASELRKMSRLLAHSHSHRGSAWCSLVVISRHVILSPPGLPGKWVRTFSRQNCCRLFELPEFRRERELFR